jgi:hypothetical protein
MTELCRRYGISQPIYYTRPDKVLSGAETPNMAP